MLVSAADFEAFYIAVLGSNVSLEIPSILKALLDALVLWWHWQVSISMLQVSAKAPTLNV